VFRAQVAGGLDWMLLNCAGNRQKVLVDVQDALRSLNTQHEELTGTQNRSVAGRLVVQGAAC